MPKSLLLLIKKMYNALIFDLDNTLYNETHYFLEVFRSFSKLQNLSFPLLERAYRQTILEESSDIFGDVLKKLHCYSRESQQCLFDLYKSIEVKLDLFDDAKDLIEFSKSKKIKMGIITNGVLEAQHNKLRCLGISHLFDSIVFAREFGKQYEKPHSLPFEKMIKQLGESKQAILFVGDTLETDIQGAKKFGLDAVLIQRTSDRGKITQPMLNNLECISDLRQLKEKFIEKN